jgi:hypothetical protein
MGCADREHVRAARAEKGRGAGEDHRDPSEHSGQDATADCADGITRVKEYLSATDA